MADLESADESLTQHSLRHWHNLMDTTYLNFGRSLSVFADKNTLNSETEVCSGMELQIRYRVDIFSKNISKFVGRI